MLNKSVFLVVPGIVLGLTVLSTPAGTTSNPAAAESESDRYSSWPVGTFALTVQAPGQPAFKELLTLHTGGTVSETNTTLHPNSAIPVVFPFNGSDGYGVWKRVSGKRFKVKFVKHVFDEDNQHFGFLVVTALAQITGDTYTNVESDVNILVGPDLDKPVDVIPLGPTDAEGKRLKIDF